MLLPPPLTTSATTSAAAGESHRERGDHRKNYCLVFRDHYFHYYYLLKYKFAKNLVYHTFDHVSIAYIWTTGELVGDSRTGGVHSPNPPYQGAILFSPCQGMTKRR